MDRLDFLSSALRGEDLSDEVIEELLALLTDRHAGYVLVARSTLEAMTNEIWVLRRRLDKEKEVL